MLSLPLLLPDIGEVDGSALSLAIDLWTESVRVQSSGQWRSGDLADQILNMELDRAAAKYGEDMAGVRDTIFHGDRLKFVSDETLLRAHQLAVSAAHATARLALQEPSHMQTLMRKIETIYQPLATANGIHRMQALILFQTRCSDAATQFLEVANKTVAQSADLEADYQHLVQKSSTSPLVAFASAELLDSWKHVDQIRLHVSVKSWRSVENNLTSYTSSYLATALLKRCNNLSWALDPTVLSANLPCSCSSMYLTHAYTHLQDSVHA